MDNRIEWYDYQWNADKGAICFNNEKFTARRITFSTRKCSSIVPVKCISRVIT